MKIIFAGGACKNHCFRSQGGCRVRKHHYQYPALYDTPANIDLRVDVLVRKREEVFLYTPDMFSDLYYEPLFLKLKRRDKGYIAVNAGVHTFRERMKNQMFMTNLVSKGIREIWFGVESGSPEQRAKFDKPNFTNEDVIQITGECTRMGLSVCWYLIDTPDDPAAELMTYKLIAAAKPFRVVINRLTDEG